MNRRVLLVALGLAVCLGQIAAGRAQKEIRRIGFLSQCSRSFDEEAFKQGLRELGYVEGVAQEMGIEVPQELLYRGDEVIR